VSASTCLVIECPRPRLQPKTPWCRLHYNRVRQGVDLDAPVRPHRTKAEVAAGLSSGSLQQTIEDADGDSFTPDPDLMSLMLDPAAFEALPPPPPPKQTMAGRQPLDHDPGELCAAVLRPQRCAGRTFAAIVISMAVWPEQQLEAAD
jgi:hypothetical protein